jgi:hypothetical protein
LARRLVPLNYAFGDRFDHDPAESLGVIPKLRDVAMLATVTRDSDDWKMLQTGLLRQRNMVANAIYEAAEVADGAVASLAGHSGVAAGR